MSQVKLPIEDEEWQEAEGSEPRLEIDADDERKPEIPTTLNILPLLDSVVYPMLIAPLSVTREASVQTH